MITTVRTLRRADIDPPTQARLIAIHDDAFGPEERQYSMASMLGQAGRSGHIFRTIRADRRVVGYTYLELAPAAALAFLWYMAIEADMRNRGIGRLAVKRTLDLLRRSHRGLRYAMFEVHRPIEEEDEARQRIDRRRIEFYRRLGAFWVQGVDYRIPAADDPTRSIAYDPMFFRLRRSHDETEIRSGVLLMARDNFEGEHGDPRWLRLQRSLPRMTIVAPAKAPDR